MSKRVKMRHKPQTETLNVSSHASEILRAASEDEAILAAAGVPQKLGYSDAENLALELGQARERIAELEKECVNLSHYKPQTEILIQLERAREAVDFQIKTNTNLRERITELEAECASLSLENEQASATLDYRLMSIATPIAAALAPTRDPKVCAIDAIEYAKALLTEIEK